MIFAIAFVYLFVGVMWVLNDFSKPSYNQPLYIRNVYGQTEWSKVVLAIVLWPIRALLVGSMHAEMRKRQRMRAEQEEKEK